MHAMSSRFLTVALSIGLTICTAITPSTRQLDSVTLPWHVNIGGDTSGPFDSDVDKYRLSDGDVIESDRELPEIYRSARTGKVEYEFPVVGSHFDVTIHLAELDDTKKRSGARSFDIKVNNATARDLDVYHDAQQRWMSYTFKSIRASNGSIRVSTSDDAIINAITIDRQGSSAPSGRSIVVKAMNVGGDATLGFDGDNASLFGNTEVKKSDDDIDNTSVPELFKTQREGDIRLSFDVDSSSYALELLFAETDANNDGERVMSVVINEEPQVAFDIYATFGKNKPVFLRYSRLKANKDGKIKVEITAENGTSMLSAFVLRKEKTDAHVPAWNVINADDESEAIPRHENCAVQFDGDIYLLGGRGLTNVTKFDTKSKIWFTYAAPPIEINHMQCGVVGDRIVVGMAFTGGFPTESTVDRLLWFQPSNNSWTWGATIPEERNRGSASMIVRNDVLYFINGNVGGHGEHADSVNWFDAYIVKDDTWIILPDTPIARDHSSAAFIDDKIIIAGGRDGGQADFFNAVVSQVDVWNFDTMSWSTASQMLPNPTGGTLSAALDDRYVIIAGGEGFDRIWPQTAIFDINQMRFVDLAQTHMRIARHGTQLVRCGNALYAACGSSWQGGAPELTSVEAFTMDGKTPLGCK